MRAQHQWLQLVQASMHAKGLRRHACMQGCCQDNVQNLFSPVVLGLMLLVPFSSALNLLPELTTVSGDLVALQALGGTTGSAPPVSIASLFVAVRLSEPGPRTTGEEGEGDSMLMDSINSVYSFHAPQSRILGSELCGSWEQVRIKARK
jgi:hypothetical protein